MGFLPAGNYQPASLSYLDAGNEPGSIRVWGKLITAANHDVQIGLFGDLRVACGALVLGSLIRDYYGEKTTYVATPPTNGAAREVALQIISHNPSSGVTYRFNLPTLDISLIHYVSNVGAKDAVDPTTTELVALTSAFEAFAVDPRVPAVNLAVLGYKVVRGLK